MNLSELKSISKYTAAVYMLVCKKNQKIYIGSTIDLKARLYVHFSKNKSKNELYKDLQKFGLDNFELQILWLSDRNNSEFGYTELRWLLVSKESELIRELKTYHPQIGYNKTIGNKKTYL
jgi:group I intron endonuclease